MILSYLAVLFCIFIQKNIVNIPFVLLFLLVLVMIRREKSYLGLIIYSGILVDLANNLTVGVTLLLFGVIFAIVSSYRMFISEIKVKDALILMVISVVFYELVSNFIYKII